MQEPRSVQCEPYSLILHLHAIQSLLSLFPWGDLFLCSQPSNGWIQHLYPQEPLGLNNYPFLDNVRNENEQYVSNRRCMLMAAAAFSARRKFTQREPSSLTDYPIRMQYETPSYHSRSTILSPCSQEEASSGSPQHLHPSTRSDRPHRTNSSDSP